MAIEENDYEEGEAEEEEEDDEEEDEQGGAMVNFLFGNVGKGGRLDEDYLDEVRSS